MKLNLQNLNLQNLDFQKPSQRFTLKIIGCGTWRKIRALDKKPSTVQQDQQEFLLILLYSYKSTGNSNCSSGSWFNSKNGNNTNFGWNSICKSKTGNIYGNSKNGNTKTMTTEVQARQLHHERKKLCFPLLFNWSSLLWFNSSAPPSQFAWDSTYSMSF